MMNRVPEDQGFRCNRDEQSQIVAIDDREGETKLRFQFVLPLADHAGWRCNHHQIDPTPGAN